MGSQVAVLLLVQLLVRVELEMLGELRPKMPADLGVMGVGWGAWRPRGAHLLFSPQGGRKRTRCLQVRRPGRSLPCAVHPG